MSISFNIYRADLEARKGDLDPILQCAFNYYPTKDLQSAELIVRVPQMLVTYPDGLERLKEKEQAPELLKYYENNFLPKVRAHIAKIKERALSGWPEEMFYQNMASEYKLGSETSTPASSKP